MSEKQQNPGRTPLWLRLVLGVSLGLNLLIAGLAIGAFARFGDMGGGRAASQTLGAAMFRELPREDRRALHKGAMRRGPHTAQMRQAQATAIATVLRADPFDPEALGDVLQTQAAQRMDWHHTAQLAWLERIAQMSTAERASYADRLYDSLTRDHGHHRPPRGRWGD